MTCRLAAALLAAIVALGATGCPAPSRERPLRAVAHLADQRYRLDGGPSTARVPAAVIAGERRPVLAKATEVVLAAGSYPTHGKRVWVRLPIPENARGARLSLSAAVAGANGAIAELKPRVRDRARAEERVRLTLSQASDGKETPLVVTARVAPASSYLTPPITVPAGARLRFGIGVDESGWSAEMPAVVFTLALVEDGRDHELWQRRLDPGGTPAHRRWIDQEVDLSDHAGRVVSLRFEGASEGGRTRRLPIHPVWGDPTLLTPGPEGKRARNLLLVSLDTLRASHLGCYGYGRPTSPTIDSVLAAQGALFERAYAHFPGTTASHMTLFTSLHACIHQVIGTPYSNEFLRADAHTLAELVRASGYATAAFTEDARVAASVGFGRGFGTVIENMTTNINEPSGQADVTFRDALGWIRRQVDRPWFAFVHTYQVHYPYAPPPGYVEQVAADHASDLTAVSAARYDAEIRYTDDLLAELLIGLESVDGGKETVVVLLADHGEQFGEHGLFKHGNSLSDVLLHVPLVVRAPGLVPPGRRIETPVGLIDVVPTVLELLGLPQARWAQGRSLAPLLEGKEQRPVPLYAELPLLKEVAVLRGWRKWIIHQPSGQARVYDLRLDPGETVDRAPAAAKKWAAELLAQYRALCAAPPRPELAAPGGGGSAPDPAVEEKLRALGYIE